MSQDSAENHPLALIFFFGQFSPVRVWLQELGMVFGSTVDYLLLGHALSFTKGFLLEGTAPTLEVTCRILLLVPGLNVTVGICVSSYCYTHPHLQEESGFSSSPTETSSPTPHSDFYTYPSRNWGQDMLEATQAGLSHPYLCSWLRIPPDLICSFKDPQERRVSPDGMQWLARSSLPEDYPSERTKLSLGLHCWYC